MKNLANCHISVALSIYFILKALKLLKLAKQFYYNDPGPS